MNNKRIVVFDLGKVLVEFDFQIAARNLAPKTKVQPADILRVFMDDGLLLRYESGSMESLQFYDEFRLRTGYYGDLNDFGDDFGGIFAEIPAMIALHADLRKRGFTTFIFSNTNPLAIDYIKVHFPFFAHFDGYIYSYEIKSMKPDSAIYEALERASGCRGTEILYLDDRPENIEAACQRGWLGLLHVTPDETIANVQKTLEH